MYGTPTNGRRRPKETGDDATAAMNAIRRIVRALRVGSRAAEKAVGLSGAQLFVLHKLADGAAVSLNELAERTLTHQSSVSVVVQRLVTQKLITRRRSARDARRIELSLTAAGRAALGKAPAAPQDRLVAAIERLPATRQKQLAQSLEWLVTEAGIEGEPVAMFFEDDRRKARGRKAREARDSYSPSPGTPGEGRDEGSAQRARALIRMPPRAEPSP